MNLLENEISDYNFLLRLIPQKKPIVMIDKLCFYSDKKIISGLTVTTDNIFTSKNYLTEPGLIENMAQTTALHTGYTYFLAQKKAPTGYIGAIKKVEIFELPKTSQKLTTTVEILHDIMGITLVQAKVHCNEKIIAQCEMKTALAQ